MNDNYVWVIKISFRDGRTALVGLGGALVFVKQRTQVRQEHLEHQVEVGLKSSWTNSEYVKRMINLYHSRQDCEVFYVRVECRDGVVEYVDPEDCVRDDEYNKLVHIFDIQPGYNYRVSLTFTVNGVLYSVIDMANIAGLNGDHPLSYFMVWHTTKDRSRFVYTSVESAIEAKIKLCNWLSGYLELPTDSKQAEFIAGIRDQILMTLTVN